MNENPTAISVLVPVLYIWLISRARGKGISYRRICLALFYVATGTIFSEILMYFAWPIVLGRADTSAQSWAMFVIFIAISLRAFDIGRLVEFKKKEKLHGRS